MLRQSNFSRTKLSRYPGELSLGEFLAIIKKTDPDLEISLQVREKLQRGKKKRGEKKRKSPVDELTKTTLSFSGSPSFLEKYGCNTGRQQRLQKSIGGGFLRSKTNPGKKKAKKIQTAIADEDAKDFLM
jgi:hypothetical protein